MPYQLNEPERRSVSELLPAQRYEHFIKRVVDWEEVWGLKGPDGWVLLGNQEGEEFAPFWPHPDYAKACVTERWAGTEPTCIELNVFRERWIPGLIRDGRKAAIFATSNSPGVVVDALDLEAAISEQIAEDYGDDD